jgi:hypothetical protein
MSVNLICDAVVSTTFREGQAGPINHEGVLATDGGSDSPSSIPSTRPLSIWSLSWNEASLRRDCVWVNAP